MENCRMKKIILALGFLVIGGAALAAAVNQMTDEQETYSWRYKITVSIETPEGVKTGSAVRQIDIVKKLILATTVTDPKTNKPKEKKHYTFNPWVTGEAVVVDLGEHGTVFTLVDWSDYRDTLIAFDEKDYRNAAALPLGSKAELTNRLPKIVTFLDMNNPMTIRLVKGHEFDVKNQKQVPVDNFEEIFGKDVFLKNITIEIVNEPVTFQIEKLLPWLDGLKGGNIDGSKITTSNDLSNALHSGHFKIFSKEKNLKRHFRKGKEK